MEDLATSLKEHYSKDELYEDILTRLRESDVDINHVSRDHISAVDEFHVRGAAVSKELAQSIQLQGLKVLDVGCGLGGPCRMLADDYNCNTVGIDLCQEYIRTATALTKLVKLSDKSSFIQADATELPFDESSFDVVWTQHVQMNIADKRKFYSEIDRVLKPGGHLLYYDILRKNSGDIAYPMPWASSPKQSFLFTSEDMEVVLDHLNFRKIASKDQTGAGIEFFENLMNKLQASGPPKLGLNVLMGESTKPKLVNLLNHLKSGLLKLESGTYQKID
ncbi:class I SAM-dependent methyltransferase [Fulvivirga ligni]|uniref:class I SAM-dependent methyltransferase n=1 Tax=Fulvivirga ligni TaxID=2904246 RepID=UPI001F46E731|nr:methyltransferase domain-containing protein [Fulvivirga ligni]UII22316.1 methyltransferase domain-containing protein [Fulvivirga ligni]